MIVDVTLKGSPLIQAMVTSSRGHALMPYQIGITADESVGYSG